MFLFMPMQSPCSESPSPSEAVQWKRTTRPRDAFCLPSFAQQSPLTRGWRRSGSRSEWATDGVNSESKWSALLFAWAHAQAQAGSCQHFRNTSKLAIQRRD